MHPAFLETIYGTRSQQIVHGALHLRLRFPLPFRTKNHSRRRPPVSTLLRNTLRHQTARGMPKRLAATQEFIVAATA